tara:strand:- start:983 stop:2044 length:1062 start_codon:yes stop_codon:yes gene_type:complete
MKLLIINDTHTGIRNSSDIFLENASKFYKDLLFPYCDKHNIKQILHLGDYYDHRKFINFKALTHNRKSFLNPMRDRGMTMDIIPGNHDTYFKNTNELNSLKELLGHYMNEVHIVMKPTVMNYGGLDIALLPWITSENHSESMNFVKNCKASILGGHLELNGFDMMRGIKNTHGMSKEEFSRFELVLSGHFHTKSQQDNIMYLGTQMEFFWSDAHDPKHFHVLDTETREIEAIVNPFTLFEKITYDDTRTDYNNYSLVNIDNKFIKVVVINKSDPFTFDRFCDRIQAKNIHELKISENFEEFMGERVGDEGVSVEDTTTLLDSYVESVDTDLDKNRIKVEMRNLLTEAQALEIT